MTSKVSFWGWFTHEGRLKNQWARALADVDRIRSLDRLRQVQQKLANNPTKFAHLWLPFLDTFLDDSRVLSLTDSDLTSVEKMGGLATAPVQPADVWLRLVKARDVRGENRQARTLLTHIYKAPSTSEDVKARCARDLARRNAKGDEHLNIYIDHLQRVSHPEEETDVLNLLANFCAVDFDTDKIRLKRAGKVARRLVEHKIQVSGVQTALGLHSLLIEQTPSKAAEHFETAFKANRQDKLALVGLLATWVQNGDYGNVAKITKEIDYEEDSVAAGLVTLNATLQWLESHKMSGPPPASAQKIEKLDLSRYAGDVVHMAIGRLYLLEGNAQRAAEILLPLADKHPEQPRWGYYAACAAALTGDRNSVARRFAALAKWPGRWTVACLLLDIDPTLAGKSRVHSHLGQASKAYNTIVQSRMALAQSLRTTKFLDWKPGAGSLEEDLEALRTVLGYALYTKNKSAVERAITMPLFHRLPLADQIMWRGLYALLSGDSVQGRALLEEAAVKFGYQRAALVLSVHLLEQNQVSEAKQFFDRGAAERRDAKIELLRAYLDACEGRTNAAAERLEKLIVQNEPRAHYALGNLYLHRAEEARKAGRLEQVKLYREQAAGAFGATLKTEKKSLPNDCEVLARCTEFVAHPDRGTESHAGMWKEAEQLAPSRRRPWIIWNAILAQIWYGNTSEAADACEEALTLLADVDHLEDSTLVAVIQAITRACVNAENIEQADKLATLLGRLSTKSELQTVKRFYRLGISAAARLRYTKADRKNRDQVRQHIARLAKADTGNGSLALLLASVELNGLEPDRAITAIRDAQPEYQLEQCLCVCFADLLQKRAPSLEKLPQAPPDAAPEMVQACHLLRAAAAFAADTPEPGYEAILAAMRNQAEGMATIVDISQFLPSLCATSTRGGKVPQSLVEAIRNTSSVSGDRNQVATFARCAAAIGETKRACQLWEQALATDKEPSSPMQQEYVKYLCHLAVAACNSGNAMEAIEKLRLASRFGIGG